MKATTNPALLPSEPTINDYSQWGMAAVIPGLQHAIDTMQEHLDQIRLQLHAAMGRKISNTTQTIAFVPAPVAVEQPAPRVKRKYVKRAAAPVQPRKRDGSGIAQYWANMTPAQRKAEMHRRQAKGLGTPSKAATTTRAAVDAARTARAARAAKPAVKLEPRHPRDPRHPGHAAWRIKLSKAQRKSAKERKKTVIDALVEGGKPNGAAQEVVI